MIFGVAIYTILQQINAIFYKQIVCTITNKPLSTALVVPLYAKSNLYKYLPGNVMHYIGRNQIAVLSEATHPQIIVCTLLELIVPITAALGVALTLSFSFVKSWVNTDSLLQYIILVGIILIAILSLLYAKIFRTTSFYKKLKIKMSTKLYIILLKAALYYALYYAFFHAISGALFLILMNIMEIDIPTNYRFATAGVYCFAWLVGLITPWSTGRAWSAGSDAGNIIGNLGSFRTHCGSCGTEPDHDNTW